MRQEPRTHSLGPTSSTQSPRDTHLTALLSTPQRGQHQGEAGLGDTCLSSLSKGFLLIRPLSLFHTVDATNDFPAIPANSCQAHKLSFSSIQYLGVFLANTELPLLAQCHVGDLLQVVFTGN